VHETFTVRATDSAGAYDTHIVSVDIGGANDAPTLTVSVGPGVPVEGGDGNSGGSPGLDISVDEPGSYDVSGTGGADFIRPGDGGQAIDAGGGDDVVYGDNDYVTGGGADTIKGGEGRDQITGGDNDDRILGNEGSDTIYGDFQSSSPNAGRDLIDAGQGDDVVIAGDNDDTVVGGEGDDLIQGDFDWQTQGGDDLIDAGDGKDTVVAGAGDDTVSGGRGDDLIYGDYRWNTAGGTDVVVYTGSRDDYVITQNPDGSYTIADQVADRDGTDTVYGAEIFRFADGDVDVSDILEGGGGGGGAGDAVRYDLNISTALVDTASSEILSNVMIDMAGVPEGTVFSAGALVDGQWVLAPDQLAGLTMTVPADAPPFRLEISVTATDPADGDTTTTQIAIGIGGEDHGVVEQTSAAPMTVSLLAVPLAATAMLETGDEFAVAITADHGSAVPAVEGDHAGLASGTDSSHAAAEPQTDVPATADHADGGAPLDPAASGVNGEVSSGEPVTSYQDLAAPLHTAGLSLSGADQAENGSAAIGAPSQPDQLALDDASLGPGAPAEHSAASDYLALAQPQNGEQGPSVLDSPSASDPYLQMAGGPNQQADHQGGLPPDQVDAEMGAAASGASDDAPDLNTVHHDDAAAAASAPEVPASHEQEHQGG
jgi:hypothetical protein